MPDRENVALLANTTRNIPCSGKSLTHIAYRGHACRAQRFNTGAKILTNEPSPSTNSQFTCEIQDHIFRSCPAAQLTLETKSKNLRIFEFPWCIHKSIDCICTTNTDC